MLAGANVETITLRESWRDLLHIAHGSKTIARKNKRERTRSPKIRMARSAKQHSAHNLGTSSIHAAALTPRNAIVAMTLALLHGAVSRRSEPPSRALATQAHIRLLCDTVDRYNVINTSDLRGNK